MTRLYRPLTVLTLLLFAGAPILIAEAPYEATMGLVQKIFYFHVPSWMAMFLGATVCGVAGAVYLFTGRAAADRLAVAGAEAAVLFGTLGLITGPLWGRKSWGVWWQWDARLTSALVLWLIYAAYLLLRRYGGPGSEKLSAAVAVFGTVNVPFVYWSVNVWRTLHPQTTVVLTLQPGMRGPFWWCAAAFVLLTVLLIAARVRLERARGELDRLYLALEDAEA
jgi:heme exporter protein C